jgi:hypothetical protein
MTATDFTTLPFSAAVFGMSLAVRADFTLCSGERRAMFQSRCVTLIEEKNRKNLLVSKSQLLECHKRRFLKLF